MAGLGLMNRRRANQSSPTHEEISTQDYVQDSLLMWLDGIEKGSNPDVMWEDLVKSDNDFANNSAVPLADGYYCGDNGFLQNAKMSYLFKETRTMEILLTFDNAPTDISIPFIGQKDCFALAVAPNLNSVIILSNFNSNYETTKYVNPFVQGGTYSVVVTNGEMYVNGTSIAKNGVGSILAVVGAVSCIGRRGDGARKFYGIVHSIRIHDRSLTADEISKNMELDRKRFRDRTF